MNHAPKATASPDSALEKRANILSVIATVLILGAIAGLVFMMVSRGAAVSCPDELIGAWTTSAKGYEDGMLLFTRTAVVFSAGLDHSDGQALRRLDSLPQGPRTLYTAVYGNSRGEEQILSFYYHTREQTITFKNQPYLVWTRKTVDS